LDFFFFPEKLMLTVCPLGAATETFFFPLAALDVFFFFFTTEAFLPLDTFLGMEEAAAEEEAAFFFFFLGAREGGSNLMGS
jgi:hypothetical protein